MEAGHTTCAMVSRQPVMVQRALTDEEASLEKCYSAPPLTIDIKGLQRAIAEAELKGLNRDILRQAHTKIAYVKRAQSAARRKQALIDLTYFGNCDVRLIDLERLHAAIELAREVDIEPLLVATCAARLAEVDAAQKARGAA